MLELLIEELTCLHSNIIVAPEISDRRTINTVAKVKQKWGEDHLLTMVIGGDLSEQIFGWHQAEQLWTNLKVLIVPRDGYNVDDKIVEKIDRHSLGCIVAQDQTPAFSSTDYRRYHNQELLTNSVQNYIKENNLYLDGKESGRDKN